MKLLATLIMLISTTAALAHEKGPSGVHHLDWHSDQIARVTSASYAWNDFGVYTVGSAGKTVEVDGDRCIRGVQFSFDVSDEYAFDIDENVTLTLNVDLSSSDGDLTIAYDANGGPGIITQQLVGTGRKDIVVELNRARFIGRGDHKADFKIMAHGQYGNVNGPFGTQVTVCDVKVERSHLTKPRETGKLSLSILDENQNPAAVRIGLYDETGRSPTPSQSALSFRKFTDIRQSLLVSIFGSWPARNRFTMYMAGTYETALPVGTYRLVATRGIEYRFIDQIIVIKPGETTNVEASLVRFANLAAENWYSGDTHIHVDRRNDQDSEMLLQQTTAEGLNLGNVLEMGNYATTYFPQYNWDNNGLDRRGEHAIFSGQEGPRTSIRGHTIHLGIDNPVRFADDYLQYHKVFEEVARQGGLSGYAHMPSSEEFINSKVGMALDVPFGNIKMVEIAQLGTFATETWFDFLNLGFKIAPIAGSDYPYVDQPGSVRSYVKTDGSFTAQKWFDGIAAGNTFVTNGPLINMTANNAGMGAQLEAQNGDEITVKVQAKQLPELGPLMRLELIEQGEVIASVDGDGTSQELELTHVLPAGKSTWLVARADGIKPSPFTDIAAITAPIYVVVDSDAATWKRSEVGFLVEKYKRQIDQLARKKLDDLPLHELEWWETGPYWIKNFDEQMSKLALRMTAAKDQLDALASRARQGE